MKSLIWRLLYRRWRKPARPPKAGYTLLLPMPGDFPFFLDIFARVFADKRSEHLVEALVIPDQVPPGFRERFDRLARSWPLGEIRLVPLRPLDQRLANLVRNPGAYHWLQLVNGVEEATASHAFLHDADAFVTAADFYEARFEECVRRDLVCLGVNPAWHRWFAERGLAHITATWELLFDLAWLRKFAPWKHRGHDEVYEGESRIFDTTLWAQVMTPPGRIARVEGEGDYIHFNYAISTYRHFQNRRGPFEDETFRVLLIRLLIDAFDPGDWPYDTPGLDELGRGLADGSARVTYRGEATAANYAGFRAQLQQLIDSPLLDDAQRAGVARGVLPFDRAFGPACRPVTDREQA